MAAKGLKGGLFHIFCGSTDPFSSYPSIHSSFFSLSLPSEPCYSQCWENCWMWKSPCLLGPLTLYLFKLSFFLASITAEEFPVFSRRASPRIVGMEMVLLRRGLRAWERTEEYLDSIGVSVRCRPHMFYWLYSTVSIVLLLIDQYSINHHIIMQSKSSQHRFDWLDGPGAY